MKSPRLRTSGQQQAEIGSVSYSGWIPINNVFNFWYSSSIMEVERKNKVNEIQKHWDDIFL